jgi:hypothetical protein
VSVLWRIDHRSHGSDTRYPDLGSKFSFGLVNINKKSKPSLFVFSLNAMAMLSNRFHNISIPNNLSSSDNSFDRRLDVRKQMLMRTFQ